MEENIDGIYEKRANQKVIRLVSKKLDALAKVCASRVMDIIS